MHDQNPRECVPILAVISVCGRKVYAKLMEEGEGVWWKDAIVVVRAKVCAFVMEEERGVQKKDVSERRSRMGYVKRMVEGCDVKLQGARNPVKEVDFVAPMVADSAVRKKGAIKAHSEVVIVRGMGDLVSVNSKDVPRTIEEVDSVPNMEEGNDVIPLIARNQLGKEVNVRIMQIDRKWKKILQSLRWVRIRNRINLMFRWEL